MSALGIEKLSASLKGRDVLHDVSFAVEPGEIVGIIGPNGAGKSTLLRSIAGLLPYTGTITIAARNLRDISAHDRARLVSYLPQEREIAWPISAAKLVALGRTPYLTPMSGPNQRDDEMVERALAWVDATKFRDRVVSDLSGGERARILIARALAQDTPLLVADEPTAGLDPAHQISLMEVFAARAVAGRTIIVALHEIALAARWCTRILLFDNGRLIADGSPKDVLTTNVFERAYGVRLHVADGADGLIVQPVARLAESL
jgi:iron complex transport system ATP-binding protein